jgi:hypothetical protein
MGDRYGGEKAGLPAPFCKVMLKIEMFCSS